MIAIVDYGMGNLKSVKNALNFLHIPSIITENENEIMNSSGIILPGVGAFKDAVDNLKKNNTFNILRKAVEFEKPLLGICLGMQLLFEEGYEVEKSEGLGFIKGTVKLMKVDEKIPHMGWNNLHFDVPTQILVGVEENSYVYFVHSYYADIKEENVINAYAEYSMKIPAVVSKGNVYGMQFHPEKSGDVGMKMLNNFWELVK